MEKVKVTQEQADWLDECTTAEEINYAIDVHLFKKRPDSPIVDWSVSKLARALYIGYEVKLDFKEGDWITNTDSNVTYQATAKSIEIISQLEDTSHLRHSTPDEIATEKTRRWWKEHDRKLYEIKQGDILMGKHRALYEVTADPKSHRYGVYTGNDEHDFDIEEFKRDNWEVVCFRVDRKDIATD